MGAKQIWVGLAIVVASGSLVSCGGMESVTLPGVNVDGETEARRADGPAGTDSTRSKPRGFQFESGFLEFGEFDPYAIGDDVFNPCTEITEEEFAEAGLEQMAFDDGNNPFSRGIPSCDFGGIRKDGSISGFHVGVMNRAIAEERQLVLTDYGSDLLPELYVTRPSGISEGACFAQVDTARGAFKAHAGGPQSRVDRDQACAMAIENVEKIFLAYGSS